MSEVGADYPYPGIKSPYAYATALRLNTEGLLPIGDQEHAMEPGKFSALERTQAMPNSNALSWNYSVESEHPAVGREAFLRSLHLVRVPSAHCLMETCLSDPSRLGPRIRRFLAY